jgi:putative ABC transport system ATP-binding protein
VAIARALANRPALILADEPTGELDAATGRGILDLFQRLAADGSTLVVVTHDERLAAEAGRVIHMLDGKIVDDVPRAAFRVPRGEGPAASPARDSGTSEPPTNAARGTRNAER